MILVTGATGTIGSEVVEQLLTAGERVRVLARDPAKATKLGAGVEIAQGDLSKPETLTAAFEGIDKVFLLAAGPDLANLEAHAITAAKRSSVKHIVKLSAMGADIEPGIKLGSWHRESEKNLIESGLTWTILRPGNFASNALSWAPSIKSQGLVYHLTGAGKTTPIDPRDIAAVAVTALTKPGHEGQIYTLTGPEALSAPEQVEKIGIALGKPLQAIDAPEAAARSGMLAEGMPRELVEALLELMALTRAGHGEKTTNTVAEVLGREARTFDVWVKDNIAAFR
jgi:(4-alkanoyl-5-oxo-2,5-dihydrofuran-3-yl)methyl phosphate reductase